MTPRARRSDTRPADEGRLTIGTLATASGIPAETIRTWERRYGFPVPERKASGHRLYPIAVVPRLRRIAQAIARGHRAAEVVPASDATLDALLAAVPGPSVATAPVALSGTTLDDLLVASRAFDGDALRRAFHIEWARLGPLEFLERCAAPFLVALGNAWASGTLDVRHEHFGSGCLGDFLRTARAPLDDRASGPMAVLATMPGEQHGLGLQMAAVVFARHGWRALVFGVDTPPEQIVAVAAEVPLAAVAVSVVSRRGRLEPATELARLRRGLPPQVHVLVGGSGAAGLLLPRVGGGGPVERLPDLTALDRWLRQAAA